MVQCNKKYTGVNIQCKQNVECGLYMIKEGDVFTGCW